jgi:hypothetical protein
VRGDSQSTGPCGGRPRRVAVVSLVRPQSPFGEDTERAAARTCSGNASYRPCSRRVAPAGKRYTHPSCCIVAASFQIFVRWLILSPLNSMSYT